jgi:hypothetical protein
MSFMKQTFMLLFSFVVSLTSSAEALLSKAKLSEGRLVRLNLYLSVKDRKSNDFTVSLFMLGLFTCCCLHSRTSVRRNEDATRVTAGYLKMITVLKRLAYSYTWCNSMKKIIEIHGRFNTCFVKFYFPCS